MSQLSPQAGAEGASREPGDCPDIDTQQDGSTPENEQGESQSNMDTNPPEQESSPTTETPAEPLAGDPEETPKEPKRENKPRRSVIVRYGQMRNVGQFRHNLDRAPRPGERVVIRTDRGVELGEVLADVCDQTCYGCLETNRLNEFVSANGPEYPFRRDGKVLRLANPQDVIDQKHLDSSAREESAFCRQQIREMKLQMRLVTVEHLLGGERIIFYFSAESRVDFRELVRRLASQYRTRIEMRQVGARDEARLVADYERCGQQCCCQQYIKDLKPVSMRMAKTQKATLDPSKISGRCGRLMCCLRYEDATYEELRKKLPKKNTWVRTADHVGRVVDTQIITQLVRLELSDRTYEAVAVEDILERGVQPPPQPEVRESRQRPPRQRPTALLRDTVLQSNGSADASSPDEVADQPQAPPAGTPANNEQAVESEAPTQKKKRRRGRRRRKSGDKPQQQAPPADERQKASESGQASGQQSGKKRRRRRRKKKSSGEGNPPAGGSE